VAWPSASATSPTTSPAHSSKPADSDHTYTPNCEEPGKQAVSSLMKGTGRALISKVSVGAAEKSASKVGQFAGRRAAGEVGKANSGGIEQGHQMPSITT